MCRRPVRSAIASGRLFGKRADGEGAVSFAPPLRQRLPEIRRIPESEGGVARTHELDGVLGLPFALNNRSPRLQREALVGGGHERWVDGFPMVQVVHVVRSDGGV